MVNNTLRFRIIDVCFQNAESYPSDGIDFFLEQDDWNDYWYYTTYHLHATSKLTGTKTQYLGVIKIMKIGQKEKEARVLYTELKQSKAGMSFSELPTDYYSISLSIDFYRGLNKYLNENQRKQFVKSMRLILGKDSNYYPKVKNEPVLLKSLLRDTNMNADALKRGKFVMFSSGDYYNWEKQTLTVRFKNSDEEVKLDFLGINSAEGINNLPSGVIAFIGHNGCGKSTSLYQIAKVLFATPSDRRIYADVLTIEPSTAGINKLLFFSYSAFDNFVLPGLTLSDYRLIAKGLEDNEGRFIFCGTRDVKTELNNYLDRYEKGKKELSENNTNDFLPIELLKNNRQSHVYLKDIDKLANEFVSAYRIINNTGKADILQKIVSESEVLLPSLYEDIKWVMDINIEEGLENLFLQKSTGIKFFLHSLFHLIAYTEENSIILFDEPENYLHPPFLSFMMKSFRQIIHQTHSVMLVATHSPVVLQEMMAKNVFILKRCGESLTFSKPRIETYGESFGIINSYVFNLNTDISSYHDVMDELYEKWNCKELDSVSKVLTRFHQRFDIDSLSSQMEAYLINKYYEDHVEA